MPNVISNTSRHEMLPLAVSFLASEYGFIHLIMQSRQEGRTNWFASCGLQSGSAIWNTIFWTVPTYHEFISSSRHILSLTFWLLYCSDKRSNDWSDFKRLWQSDSLFKTSPSLLQTALQLRASLYDRAWVCTLYTVQRESTLALADAVFDARERSASLCVYCLIRLQSDR